MQQDQRYNSAKRKTWKKKPPTTPQPVSEPFGSPLPLKENRPTTHNLPEIADRRKSQKYSSVDFLSFGLPRTTRMLFVQVGSRGESPHCLQPAHSSVKMHSFHKTGWATLSFDYIGSLMAPKMRLVQLCFLLLELRGCKHNLWNGFFPACVTKAVPSTSPQRSKAHGQDLHPKLQQGGQHRLAAPCLHSDKLLCSGQQMLLSLCYCHQTHQPGNPSTGQAPKPPLSCKQCLGGQQISSKELHNNPLNATCLGGTFPTRSSLLSLPKHSKATTIQAGSKP